MHDRILDWRSNHDPRSREFSIAPLTASRPRPASTYWGNPRQVLDQGREGACVGFAWTNKLLALPLSTQLSTPPNDFARTVYRQAQKIDEWDGENYSGTSVLAGAKIVKGLGYISEYRWAFSIEDILNALAHVGPVVLGIPWLEAMYDTEPGGLVTVGGTKVGGHAITATGYGTRSFPVSAEPGRKATQTLDVIRWRNSWGPTYGVTGDGYIRVSDLETLLKGGGEACVPIRK